MSGEQAFGRSRGDLTTRRHLPPDTLGNPVRLILTGGQARDRSLARELIEGLKSDHVIADEAWTGGASAIGDDSVRMPASKPAISDSAWRVDRACLGRPDRVRSRG